MKTKLFFCAFLLLTRFAAADTESYRFSRPVEWQGGEQQELLSVLLDSRIYNNTRDGFPDLRLLDQNGVETPFLLEKIAETRTEDIRLTCKSQLRSLKKKDKAIEVYLSLDKNAQSADGLTVETPLTNFEHRVQLFGSDNGQNWSPLVKEGEIFDYSNYMAVSNRDIPLPANNHRHFKVVIEEATQTREQELLELTRKLTNETEAERSERITLQRIPLKIDRIVFWSTQTDVLPETDKRFDYPLADFKVTQDKEKQTTVIDVTTLREPLTGFNLQIATVNYNRSAVVEIPVRRGIETDRQVIGSAALESLQFRNISRIQNDISFPEQRQNSYRVVISDNDNPPLEITRVNGIGHGYRLLFLPLKGKTYSLRYGSEKAKRPSYDSAPIRELLRRGYKSVSVGLGAEFAENDVKETLDFAQLLNSKLFLGAVAVLMVLVLAWSLVRVGKRVEQFPKE